MQRWSPGDTVVWRTGQDGKVWSAFPMTVVRDTPDPSWPLPALPEGWDEAT